MTQNENRDDLYEYGRRGRGVGLSIMLALLAVLVLGGLFWFGTHGSDEISDERLAPQRQTTGAGTGARPEMPNVRPPADKPTPPPAARQ